jgi:hypothetical protein
MTTNEKSRARLLFARRGQSQFRKNPTLQHLLDEPRLSYGGSEVKSCTLREFVELL